MRMPAGRPCLVITISSSTASRRYFERSSLTSARATSFALLGWRTLFVEPGLRFGLRDNCEDLDLRLCNVIEHPDVANAQAILRLAQAPEALDPTLADLRRLVRHVYDERLRDARPNRHREILEGRRGCRRKDDLECHSSYILARFQEMFQTASSRFSGLTPAFTSGRP